MYQACRRPGRKPRPAVLLVGVDASEGEEDIQHKAMLIRLSAEHSPRLIHTAKGGKMMAMRPRQTSEPHMLSICITIPLWIWKRVSLEVDVEQRGSLMGICDAEGEGKAETRVTLRREWRRGPRTDPISIRHQNILERGPTASTSTAMPRQISIR